MGGRERCFEPRDLCAVVALELRELSGKRAHDVALRRWLGGLDPARDSGEWCPLLLGAELLDPGAQR